MKATEIGRMSFNEIKEVSLVDARADLARKAEQLLGYGKLANVIVNTNTLAYALRDLGIEPLQQQSVLAYKQDKTKTGMYSGTKWGLAYAAFGLATLTDLIYWSVKLAGIAQPSTLQYTWEGVVIALLVWAVIGNLVCLFGEYWGHGNRRVTRWYTDNIKDYSGNIPEFALDKAVQIKTSCPQASFLVEYLVEENERRQRPLPDPFLLVCCGHEKYYIDVWDEKEYEAHM